MTKLEQLCALLPAEVMWGDMLTPDIVEQIANAERSRYLLEVQESIRTVTSEDRLAGIAEEYTNGLDWTDTAIVVGATSSKIVGFASSRRETFCKGFITGAQYAAGFLGLPLTALSEEK